MCLMVNCVYFRAVKFTSKLFGSALSRRIKATILYATETGKSEQFAKKLNEMFGHAFHSQVSNYVNIYIVIQTGFYTMYKKLMTKSTTQYC